MNAKITMHQYMYVIFIKPRKFDTADTKYFTEWMHLPDLAETALTE